jgi:ABC-type branched-subunit amino acid transport system substrate-binding protein
MDGARAAPLLAAEPASARSSRRPPHAVRVGLVVPTSGLLGLVGPAAINCAALATAELNAAGGLLGRPVELVLVDGGRPAEAVACEVGSLVRAGALHAVVGLHASDVRVAVARAVGAAVPYVYTPPYEGGERSPGVYLAGETPGSQLRPVLRWLAGHRRARRWFLLGNDYVWPRRVNVAAHRYLTQVGATVAGERYVDRGAVDPQPLLDQLAATRVDAVLLTLIGRDLIEFNRAFARSRLAQRVLRLSPALEENGLLGTGGDTTGELYATMGYFATVVTEPGLAFGAAYARRFGAHAPVPGGHSESCYEGILLLAALAERAGTLDTGAMDAVADGTTLYGARGRLSVHGRHVLAPTYLARADGLDLDVVASF